MADVRYAIDHLGSTIRSLEGLSGTDHLTGIYNRRQGEKRLAEEAARLRRSGEVLTVAVVDVNDFKSITTLKATRSGTPA
jgi:PleD family two-component response regulator